LNPETAWFFSEILGEKEKSDIQYKVIGLLILFAVAARKYRHQILKNATGKPIIRKAMNYFFHSYYEADPKERTIYKWETFLDDARKMMPKGARKSSIVKAWDPKKRDRNKSLGETAYDLDAIHFFDEILAKKVARHLMIFNLMQKDFSSMLIFPASQYLPAPHLGWDDHLREEFNSFDRRKRMAWELAFLEAEEFPFEILDETKKKYEDEWSAEDISLDIDEEDDKRDFLYEVDQKIEGSMTYYFNPKTTPLQLIDDIINQMPKSKQKRLHKLRSVLTESETSDITKTRKMKIPKLAKLSGESERTLRDDFKYVKTKWDEKLKDTTIRDTTPTAPLKSIVTDRAMMCSNPKCKTTFPPKTKKLIRCPFCGTKLKPGSSVTKSEADSSLINPSR
jgi:hypothetical protein